MKTQENWRPTKVVRGRKGFEPSADPSDLSVSSRIVASCQIQYYQRALEQHAHGRLLDLGCGYVPYYELYKSSVDEVICVDWENSLHKNEFLDYFMDLSKPLTIESESFDTVLLTDVLEHIYQPLQLLSEVVRVLRRGGHVIIGVPFFYWLHESPFDFHRYTEFALRRMCADLKLEIKSLYPYGGMPEIVIDIAGKCIASARPAMLCKIYTSFFIKVLALKPVRRISLRTAKAFPLGYTLVAQKV
jgi:SAM-dependent methyltransferase